MGNWKIIAALAATAALAFLTACGGGSGGGGSAPGQTEDERFISEYRSALGGTPLNLTTQQIRSALENRRAMADRILATDTIGSSPSGPFRDTTTCSGDACMSFGDRITASDLDLATDYQALMVRNGVSVVAGGPEVEFDGDSHSSALALGGWLDHTAFFVTVTTLLDANDVVTAEFFSAVSAGKGSGSNPAAGSARWTGVMTGIDTLNGQTLQGDARLTVDFAASSLDASFTNIHDDEIMRRGNILFNDVPLTADGFASRANGRIEGKFYGPGHAEAGGIFERGNTIGTFGAKRQ